MQLAALTEALVLAEHIEECLEEQRPIVLTPVQWRFVLTVLRRFGAKEIHNASA